MKSSTTEKKRSWPRRRWLMIAFVLFFLIGGLLGWGRLMAEHDIGSQGLTGLEPTPQMQDFRNDEPRRFLTWGVASAVLGTSCTWAFSVLFARLRRAHR